MVWLRQKVTEWGSMQALIDYEGWCKWRGYNTIREEGLSGSKQQIGEGEGSKCQDSENSDPHGSPSRRENANANATANANDNANANANAIENEKEISNEHPHQQQQQQQQYDIGREKENISPQQQLQHQLHQQLHQQTSSRPLSQYKITDDLPNISSHHEPPLSNPWKTSMDHIDIVTSENDGSNGNANGFGAFGFGLMTPPGGEAGMMFGDTTTTSTTTATTETETAGATSRSASSEGGGGLVGGRMDEEGYISPRTRINSSSSMLRRRSEQLSGT